jgi:hypothetical protein
MSPPVPHIEIETPPAIDPFLPFFGKVGMAQDDDFKPFQKLLMSKDPESRRGFRGLLQMILLVAQLAHPSGDPPREPGACQIHQTIGPSVLQDLPKGPILPLLGIA